MYTSLDSESARLRGAHLHEVVRLTPQTMLANVGSAVLMLVVFSPNVSLGMWLWAGVMRGLPGLGELAPTPVEPAPDRFPARRPPGHRA